MRIGPGTRSDDDSGVEQSTSRVSSGPTQEARAAKTAPAQAPAEAEREPPAATVLLSPGAKAAQAVLDRTESHASARVEALKAQIAAGSYRIDFDKLVMRLLSEELARAGGT